MHGGKRRQSLRRDILITAVSLACATALCFLLQKIHLGDAYVAMIFVLAVAAVARFTDGYVCGIVASLAAVIGVNYAFTEPYFAFCLTLPGYPLSFLCFFTVSILISTMTTQIKQQEERNYRAQLEEMRANLMRAVSHDLRTPLTSIAGAANLMLETPDMSDENRKAMLLAMAEDSQWLIRMVENLLSITRISTETAKLQKSSEAAEEIISEAVRKFRKRFPELPVEISLPDALLMAPMDPILIEQVIANLLENAAIHALNATKVRVNLRREGDFAVFEICDNGVGLQKKHPDDVFDSTVSHASDSKRNMGIGLSVCKAIILAHGGTIFAKNNRDGGACFCFSLPLKEEDHDDAHSSRRG